MKKIFSTEQRPMVENILDFQELYRFMASSVLPSTIRDTADTAFSMAEYSSFFSASVNWDSTQSARL